MPMQLLLRLQNRSLKSENMTSDLSRLGTHEYGTTILTSSPKYVTFSLRDWRWVFCEQRTCSWKENMCQLLEEFGQRLWYLESSSTDRATVRKTDESEKNAGHGESCKCDHVSIGNHLANIRLENKSTLIGEVPEWKNWIVKECQYLSAVEEKLYSYWARGYESQFAAWASHYERELVAAEASKISRIHTDDTHEGQSTPDDHEAQRPHQRIWDWRRFLCAWQPAHRHRYRIMLMIIL